jgi:hypothetical protein
MAIVLQLDQLTGRLGVAVMSREIDTWLRAEPGRTLHQLATKATLADATVSRVYYRETVEPRFLTICMLLKAVGFVAARFDKVEDLGKSWRTLNAIPDGAQIPPQPERQRRERKLPGERRRQPVRIAGAPVHH